MKPNIILIFCDQLRQDALGCYGNEICKTPHLDALAQRGRRFTHAFCTSPQCSPSRTSLMTGRYPHEHGVMVNTHLTTAWNRGLDPQAQTFVEPLKAAGYALDYVGKWHVHEDLDPTAFGFDRHQYGHGKGKQIRPGSELVATMPYGEQVIAGIDDNPDSRLVREANVGIQWIKERAAQEQPFFLRVDHIEPHFPCMAPAAFADQYQAADIPPWPNFPDDLSNKPHSHHCKSRQWGLGDKPWSFFAESLARYYAVVSALDEQIGRYVRCIDELGIWDETIFIVTCDHGDAQGSHGHFEKAGTMYDEIFRLPFIVAGPVSLVQPGVCDSFVRLQDLMPTFCAFAEQPVAETLSARSLLPLLRGEEEPRDWTDGIYAEHHGGQSGYCTQRMYRTKEWKYCYEPFGSDELYDLKQDPYEMHNLINDPEHADILETMRARMMGWNDASGDHLQWKWSRNQFPEPLLPNQH